MPSLSFFLHAWGIQTRDEIEEEMIIALLQQSNVYVRSLAVTHMTLLVLVDLYFLQSVYDLSID